MEVLRTLLERLVYISLVSSMMFGLIVCLRLLFLKRTKAKYMYLLWVLLLVRLVFPWEIPFQASIENYVPLVFEDIQESRQTILNPQVNQHLITYGALEKEIYETPSLSTRAMEVLVYLWLFGVFAIMLFPMISYVTLMKALSRDQRSTDPRIERIAFQAAKQAGVQRLQIRYSYFIDTPALIGVIHPMIILPYDVLDVEDEVIYQILLHELVHFGYQHLLFQWAFWFVKAIYWFNPIVWLAHEWMKMDAEYACDEEVIAIMGTETYKSYGKTLITLASQQGGKNYAIHASGLVHSKKELHKRILRISHGKKMWRGLEYATLLILVVMIPIFFTVEANNQERKAYKIHQSMTASSLVGEAFSLEPIMYSYDSESEVFRLEMDYAIEEGFAKEVDYNSYVLSFGLIFPDSYNKEIRESAALDRVVLSEAVKADEPLVLSFDVQAYNLKEHGRPMLVFLGYEISYNLMEEDQIHVDLMPEKLPMQIEVSPYLTLDVVEAQKTQDNRYKIRYAYEVKEPMIVEMDTRAYISLWDELAIYNAQGEPIQTPSSSGSNGETYITKTVELSQQADVDKVRLTIYGYQLYKEIHLLHGTTRYQELPREYIWRLPIEEEDIAYE